MRASKGILKPIPQSERAFKINGNSRIADGIDVARRELWEVKSVKELDGSYKAQIQDSIDYANQLGYRFQLYVRGPDFDVPTHITAPMREWLQSKGLIPPCHIGDIIC
ncbi:MAG: hypothetical protein HY942_01755 [Gammaproteobacteria bacterium]|nr:hypothetical protein [Gammaproteobacteria bacterium]